VLVVGGSRDETARLAARLARAGHRLAVQSPLHALPPAAGTPGVEPSGTSEPHTGRAPVSLAADRADPEDLTRLVTAAERVLDGLDAVVILPGTPAEPASLDSDPVSWAGSWSHALESDLLAVACLAHAAARSFVEQRQAGQIVLVAGSSVADDASTLDSTIRAGVTALGAELARQLRGHDVAVTVLTVGHAIAQGESAVPAMIEAALSARLRRDVDIRIG